MSEAARAAPDAPALWASTPAPGVPFCCSWSGGKDSCLALHRARAAGAEPRALLTLLTEDGSRTRSHGLRRAVLEAQAQALGLELRAAATSWGAYEETLARLLDGARRDGMAAVVFGDMDVEANGRWEERGARAAGLVPHLPLWGAPRRALLAEGWRLGLEARLVVVRADVLGPEHLGRRLDAAFAAELEQRGIDACGEGGEFHTLAVDGPGFARGLPVAPCGRALRGGCWVEDLRLG